MKIKINNLAAIVAASVVLLGAASSARAADKWFVMGEQTLNATDPSPEIKTEGPPDQITSAISHRPNPPSGDGIRS